MTYLNDYKQWLCDLKLLNRHLVYNLYITSRASGRPVSLWIFYHQSGYIMTTALRSFYSLFTIPQKPVRMTLTCNQTNLIFSLKYKQCNFWGFTKSWKKTSYVYVTGY